MDAQLKNGNVRDGVNVAAQLLAPQRPQAVQHFGYALMQHLVRLMAAFLTLRDAGSLVTDVCVPPPESGRLTLGGVQRR